MVMRILQTANCFNCSANLVVELATYNSEQTRSILYFQTRQFKNLLSYSILFTIYLIVLGLLCI